MLKKMKWFVAGVAVALIVAGGVLFSYSAGYFEGVYVENDGIGMNGVAIPGDARMIKWNGGPYMQSVGASNESLIMKCASGGEVRMDSLDANNAGSRIQTTFSRAALLGFDDSYVTTSTVRALQDGNAYMESLDGGSKVEVTSDGDVIITLGS